MSSTPPPGVRLSVRVQPRASRNRITGWRGEVLAVALTAPPVGGAANAALVELIADALEVKRDAVRIVAGQRSRRKIVEVCDSEPKDLEERIAALAAGRKGGA